MSCSPSYRSRWNFLEGKHGYPIHYVGNPTVDEVTAFLASSSETFDDFVRANGLSAKPVIALLAGSRKQEIQGQSARHASCGSFFSRLSTGAGRCSGYFPQSITNVMWVGRT